MSYEVVILGGGVSGLANSFYLKDHFNLTVSGFEKESYLGGHARSWKNENGVWDEGVHIFFGKQEDVTPFFSFEKAIEIPAQVLNYADGYWIPQPIYVNLCNLPEYTRNEMVHSLINAQFQMEPQNSEKSENYADWLLGAYGEKYAKLFPFRYNQKYWRIHPSKMSTNWIEPRMFVPSVKQIEEGCKNNQGLHYIKKFIYPNKKMFSNFFEESALSSNFETSSKILSIDLHKRIVHFDKQTKPYDILINTIPLPTFINLCKDAPQNVLEAARKLKYTKMHLVNLKIRGNLEVFFHWAYIHDEDLLSTRVTNYNNLRNELDNEFSFLQVEIYISSDQKNNYSSKELIDNVTLEMKKIKLIPMNAEVTGTHHYVDFANVCFDIDRERNLDIIYDYLSNFGLERNSNEYRANFRPSDKSPEEEGNEYLFLSGRFAQWNYYWTHDCVLRAKEISNRIIRSKSDH